MKYGIMGGIVIDAFVSTSFEFNGKYRKQVSG